MIQITIPIIAAAEKASLADALPHLLGFLVVLVTLATLWAICAITGKVITSTLPPAPVAPVTTAAPKQRANDSIPPEILVVIAAAVNASVGRPRRIVSVQPHNPVWSQAGRQQIHSSHNLR